MEKREKRLNVFFQKFEIIHKVCFCQQVIKFYVNDKSLFCHFSTFKYIRHKYVCKSSVPMVGVYFSRYVSTLKMYSFDIGDGKVVRLYMDNWIPTHPPQPTTSDEKNDTLLVKYLIRTIDILETGILQQ